MENPPMPEIDFEAEGMLEGLEGEAREARLALLQELTDDGVPIEDLREAAAAGRLVLLPVERALVGGAGPKYTAREIAECSGVELELLQRSRVALGVSNPDPDERVLGDDDLEAAERLRAFREAGLPEDGILQVSRTIGMAMARIAQANRALILRTVVQPGDNERDLARRLEAAAKVTLPLVGPVLSYALQTHLLEQIRRDVIAEADLASGEIRGISELTVCFADLIDFTRLGEQVPADELGVIAGRLEEMATAVTQGPLQLVKMIGDAAMLVSTEPEPLGEAALSLVEAADAEGEDFPQLRAGLAHGPVVARGGDFYGRTVNLASRITQIARPGSVLATQEAKKALGDRFHYSFARERRLKGIDDRVRLYRVRRQPKDAEA
jgi:adenylate cyclase